MIDVSDQEKYKWIEFHKWTFKADYYYPLSKNQKLVLNTRFNFGYLGYYNKDIGPSPFENFSVGGDGMTGYSFYGREMIKLRGYGSGSNGVGALTPVDPIKGAPQVTFIQRLQLNYDTLYLLILRQQFMFLLFLNQEKPGIS